MRIGIYLAYTPIIGMSFVNEGLGRYLVMLIKMLQKNQNDVLIACPTWLTGAMGELLEEYDVPLDSIQFVTNVRPPVMWRVYERQHTPRKARRRLRDRLASASSALFGALFTFVMSAKNMLVLLLLALAALVVGVILLPFALLYFGVKAIKGFILRVLRIRKKDEANSFIDTNPLFRKLDKRFHIKEKLPMLSEQAREIIRKTAAQEMIFRINHLKEKPDVWYCPMAYWAEFGDIDGVTVCCFPDIVPAIFAEGFSPEAGMIPSTQNIRKTVNRNTYFIVYSEYQKNAILVNMLGKEPENIKSITLFVNETLPYLNIQSALPDYWQAQANWKFAQSLLPSVLTHNKAPQTSRYLRTPLRDFSFEGVRYIFYPSYCRPTKNVMTLIRAYEHLLRKEEKNLKLVLTGSLSIAPSIEYYVNENRLQYDILTFSHVSNQQLAALYKCAALAVTPTLFEGGFPMTFCEGMSVGTPSILGRIPQVTEFTDPYGLDDCLFEPTDYLDLARKIDYWLEHREELIERQKPLYDMLSNWSLNEAGAEYEKAFQHFIALDAQERSRKAHA